jgi:ABC-type transport system involved in multi-copper enzyme maturation permease subunit
LASRFRDGWLAGRKFGAILASKVILDAIIAIFVSLFAALSATAAVAFVPVVNFGAFILEAIVGLFVSGFAVGRMSHPGSTTRSPVTTLLGLFALLAVLGVIAWLAVAPVMINRTVTLRAVDGHSLPFAELTIQTKQMELSRRTDSAGNISIPRFGVKSLTVKDPRYIEKSWLGKEIESVLVVERTVLGSGLDKIAEKLLRPAG